MFGDDVESLFADKVGPDQAVLDSGGYISAVRDASFEVFEGEIFVIMGLSGSGKSTLLRCMTRLIEPSAGEIYFESQDLMQVSETELIEMRRHKMGMVFQHFALLPNRSVLGNVELPLEVQGIGKAARERRDLLVARQQLCSQRRALESVARALLRSFGVKVGRVARGEMLPLSLESSRKQAR